MWPFRPRPPRAPASDPIATPTPDPIGDICRALAERPWEWSADTRNVLAHTSGVRIEWDQVPSNPAYPLTSAKRTAAVVIQDGIRSVQSERDSARLDGALAARAAALVARPRHTFTQSAVLLADAVKAGDEQAAYALADEVMEHAKSST